MRHTHGPAQHLQRYEPLQDPKKQDVHYRASKNRIMSSLGISSYRNGCQFAILWVSPDGEVSDAYASEALHPKLAGWLGPRVLEEAKGLVKAQISDRDDLNSLGGGVYGSQGEMYRPSQQEAADEDMSDGEVDDDSGRLHRSGRSARGDESAIQTRARSTAGVNDRTNADSNIGASTSSRSGHRSSRSMSASEGAITTSLASPSLSQAGVTSPSLSAKSTFSKDDKYTHKFTPEQLSKWFVDRLRDLSHKVDKLVCRSWIKVIEPQKQTKYPYQKGDETKPAWWPAQIRHKEPDHLGKPERIALLLHILRLPTFSINQLKCGTSSISTLLPREKIVALHNIYQAAQAERLALASSPAGTYDNVFVTLSRTEEAEPRYADEDNVSSTFPGPEGKSSRTQRSRGRPSIGSPNAADLPMNQQTPRSVRASPYPLARSASATHELSNLSLTSAGSPSLESNAASASLSRSHSHAGIEASAARLPRLSGRASVGESDLQTTPYQGGRVRSTITPRQAAAQASPLSASMGRSASTSAIGAKTMMDDSVASPAMIKSRSKLSQKCFEQMGAGPRDSEGNGNSGSDFGQLPQPPPKFPVIHPHHLQSARPPAHPEGFPPPPPVPYQHQQQQHRIVQSSHAAFPRHPHPQQPSHGSAQAHMQNAHMRNPRQQIQVQVQVNAGHDLPMPSQSGMERSIASQTLYADLHQPMYSQSPNALQPTYFSPGIPQAISGQFDSSEGLMFEQTPNVLSHSQQHGYLATSSNSGTPSLSSYINSPELQQQQHGFPIHPNLVDPAYYVGSNEGHLSPENSDLNAYVRQLEGLERRQQQHLVDSASTHVVGLGFDPNEAYDLPMYADASGTYDSTGGYPDYSVMATTLESGQGHQRYEGHPSSYNDLGVVG
ncbi:uncharacterized protein JCM15063_006159 [Sporobolomyces koalae]|uniref:uncharacterized protein n=1 Tax=Sporobolomyces koalae TaxID=500713 RepID=UPI00317123FE